MATHTAGRESSILDDMQNGTKTVEIRLNRGKFMDFQVGDLVEIREDYYHDGEIVKSIEKQLITQITRIESYSNFKEAFEVIGYEKITPRAKDLKDALEIPYKFYSQEEEKEFGVLAIYFKVVN